MKKKIKSVILASLVLAIGTSLVAMGIGAKPVYVLASSDQVEINPIATTGDKITGYVVRGIQIGRAHV